jgi:bla regulator protein BlaR1
MTLTRVYSCLFVANLVFAQSPGWPTAAGGKMAFEVASVKPSQGAFTPPNFPLDAGDAYINMRTNEPPTGRFKADFPLSVYIQFAYKLHPTPEQMESIQAHLPKPLANERFSIEARAEGNPTKDQMRLMMQSLLADRFKLAIHFESREVPVFDLTLLKPGKTGPNLRPHSEGPPCDAPAPSIDVFPPICDVYAMTRKPNGANRLGSRNTTMDLIAAGLPSQGRPVVDETGLTGRFDFRLEWTPETTGTPGPNSDVQPDAQGPTFLEALREQLGLKLEPAKSPMQTLVIDHVERPSEN